MKLEILIIQDDIEIIHRSISNVEDYANPYSIAIEAIINELTGHNIKPIKVNKFAEAVPNYVPHQPNTNTLPVVSTNEFHPDLIQAGVTKTVEHGIPTVKLDMKTILKGNK